MAAINLISALLLTECVECAVAYIIGYREKYFYKILILANILTNTLINYVLILLAFFNMPYSPLVMFLEVLVVVSEWRIFLYAIKGTSKSFLSLSVVLNISSYLVGVMIYGYF